MRENEKSSTTNDEAISHGPHGRITGDRRYLEYQEVQTCSTSEYKIQACVWEGRSLFWEWKGRSLFSIEESRFLVRGGAIVFLRNGAN